MGEIETLPEWLAIGSKVAVMHRSRLRGDFLGGFGTVLRATKTQVIVEQDGTKVRYRRSDQHEVGVDYYEASRLRPANDKFVRASLMGRSVSRALSDLTRVIEANRRHGNDLDRAVSEVSAIKVAADKALAELGRIHEEFSEQVAGDA